MQVKTIRAIARAYNAGLNDRTVNLFKQFKKLKAQRDAAQKALAEEQAKSKSLYENQQDIADTNKRVCERLLAVKAERDAAVARIATLEQQLTDAASRINELEASSVAPAVAPEYPALPEGCEIGEGFRQLAYGEVPKKGDWYWDSIQGKWVVYEINQLDPIGDDDYIFQVHRRPTSPARKKYEAPEYQPLPEGCEIGEGYYQLAVGEVLQEGDEYWDIMACRWSIIESQGFIANSLIYRRKK